MKRKEKLADNKTPCISKGKGAPTSRAKALHDPSTCMDATLDIQDTTSKL